MLRQVLLIPLLVSLIPLRAEEAPPPEANNIVPKEAKLELLWTRSDGVKGGLTEGPAARRTAASTSATSVSARTTPKSCASTPGRKRPPSSPPTATTSNGLMFDARGYLVACEGSDKGGRCVARYDVKTGKRIVLAERFMGKHFNAPNDLCIDLKGRIYFTDPRYLGDEPRELKYRAVYRVGKDGGTVIEITHDVEKPNGIALSPDQKTLYVADHNDGTDKIDAKAPAPKHGAMKLYAFPLGADGKVAGPRKTLLDFGSEAGIDGMTVDAKGNLYLAVRSLKRPGILVIDPQGKELAYIPTGKPQPGARTPVGLPSNCDFGIGDESKVLYVTVDVSLYRIRLKVDGYHIPWQKK